MKALPSFETALARMRERIIRLDDEIVPLDRAHGRVLAEPVLADRDQPPFDASAMDGWAVRREDAAQSEALLRIVGQSAAGHRLDAPVGPGEAARIFTGAPMPPGADWVVVQEKAERSGDHVRLGPIGHASSNVRARGADFHAGQVLVQTGERLDAWRLALVAASGRTQVSAARMPVVAILATGDELVRPGHAPAPDQIHDSAGPALAALVMQWGGRPIRLPTSGDTIEAVIDSLGVEPFDLLLTIGGASVGDHDQVKPALRSLGLSLTVEGVAIRPGKPVWFGLMGQAATPVLGLPGNPASALVCAELFLRPILSDLMGRPVRDRRRWAVLDGALPANGPREHFLRGRAAFAADGTWRVEAFDDQDSSLVSVFSRADVLIYRPPGAPAAAPGSLVQASGLDRL